MTERTAKPAADAAEPSTFVLIPGAGADPRAFGATIAALREPGHDGVAPPPARADDPQGRRGGGRLVGGHRPRRGDRAADRAPRVWGERLDAPWVEVARGSA